MNTIYSATEPFAVTYILRRQFRSAYEQDVRVQGGWWCPDTWLCPGRWCHLTVVGCEFRGICRSHMESLTCCRISFLLALFWACWLQLLELGGAGVHVYSRPVRLPTGVLSRRCPGCGPKGPFS